MFRDNPYSLFTRTDFAAYMYHRFHALDLEVRIRDVRIQRVHREYPAHFRIRESVLRDEEPLPRDLGDPMTLDLEKGGRPRFDMVILSEGFVRGLIEGAYAHQRQKTGADPREMLEHIINQDVRLTRKRRDQQDEFIEHRLHRELDYAFQFTLVTDPSPKMVAEIHRNHRLLALASQEGAMKCVHLIFCNTPEDSTPKEQLEYLEQVREKAVDNEEGMLSIFVHAWFSKSLQKNNTRPLVGRLTPLWARDFLERTSHRTV